MATNNNSKTGYYYGVINGNHVSMEALDIGGAGWINLDEVNYIAGVKKKLLAWLNNDDAFNARAAADSVDMGHNGEFMIDLYDMWTAGPVDGTSFKEPDLDDVMQYVYDIMESGADTWEFSDAKYHLLFDSNENVVWVMDSPYVALVRPAFQGCYPNCGDLDSGRDYGLYYHALGLEFFDESYTPCPYVPVPIASLKMEEK